MKSNEQTKTPSMISKTRVRVHTKLRIYTNNMRTEPHWKALPTYKTV